MKFAARIFMSLNLLWFIVLLLGFSGYAVSFTVVSESALRLVLIAAFCLFCIIWIWFGVRVFRFMSRLRIFFRRILANDYDTGLQDIHWIRDGITALTVLGNRTADQIRAYDKLRAERTEISYRAMNMLFRSSKQALMIAEIDKKQFRLNPAAQEMYGVKQETYSFESIEKQQANTRFFRTFLIVVLKDAVTKTAESQFKLPQREAIHNIEFQIEPIKDRSEKVRFAIIYINACNCSRVANVRKSKGESME